MAPYIGESKTLLKLAPAVASGLVASGVVVEVPEGASPELVEKIWDRKFGEALSDSVAEATHKASSTGEKPRGNDSREKWVAYALSQGKSEDDLAGLKQTEIRELLETANPETSETGNTEPEDKDKNEGDGSNADETE